MKSTQVKPSIVFCHGLWEEISPIQVEGESWRRLKVIFPARVSSHTRTQISCFGPDGLLRRHDYTVDILGGAKGLNYASNYRNVDGIAFPATRRVVAYEGDYQPLRIRYWSQSI